jgi:hypothetical protein
MKKVIILLIQIVVITSCLEKENTSFDNWKGFKLAQYQSGPVENYTQAEIDNLKYKEVEINKLKPLLKKFEEIDSLKIPVWFDNMLAIVTLNNGDSLKINVGFPTALFRNIKTRKIYILRNQYYAKKWQEAVFGNLILN